MTRLEETVSQRAATFVVTYPTSRRRVLTREAQSDADAGASSQSAEVARRERLRALLQSETW